jgi:TPR repeat protein
MKRDPARAAQLYREAAEAGNGMAQNNLGAAYMKGEGVERNDPEAIQWLTRSAEQDVDAAQSTLAVYCGGDNARTRSRWTLIRDKWLRARSRWQQDAKRRVLSHEQDGREGSNAGHAQPRGFT